MPSSRQIFLESLIALAAVSTASSFSGIRVSFLVPSQHIITSSTFRRHGLTRSSLPVLIYGWDDDDDDECTVTEELFNDVGIQASVCSPIGVAIAESISTNEDKLGTLARLAAAFSPPERAIDLKDIENVNLICVSEKHIEIEAVLCEENDCVRLLVPIEFPHDCGNDASDTVLEKCVLDNLAYLDLEADSLVVNSETEEEDDVSLEELSNVFSYPSWWVSPEGNDDILVECDTVKRLLSDPEFQDATNALARKGLEALGIEDIYEINKAFIAAVGPAGLCLKARASSRSDGEAVVLDVPLPFGGEPRLDPELIRAAVLGEVAACQVL
mmetsp:Transcript_34212/g.50300  ORF Transcript_34212/g.50300 Transcript_34212/m.50300 type:complete len:328 (-) Transcript_34212:95-1078(-)